MILNELNLYVDAMEILTHTFNIERVNGNTQLKLRKKKFHTYKLVNAAERIKGK